jgi:pentapeptide repeat protein
VRWWRRGPRSRALKDALVAELRRPQRVDDNHLLSPPKSAPRASLVGADLHGADLRWADLQYCDLRNADLSGALLDSADLSWATLNRADLTDTQFGRARMVETVLQSASLTGADLSNVTGLTWAAVRGVDGARSVKWPPNFDPSPPRVAGPLIHPHQR